MASHNFVALLEPSVMLTELFDCRGNGFLICTCGFVLLEDVGSLLTNDGSDKAARNNSA